MLKSKIIFLLFIAAIIFFGCISNYAKINHNNDSAELGQIKNQVAKVSGKFVVDNGDASLTEDFVVEDGASVLDLMKKMQEDGKIIMQYKDSSVGAFIDSINSIKNNKKENRYWMLYVNGEISNVGVSDYQIANNDVIEWRFVDTSEIPF